MRNFLRDKGLDIFLGLNLLILLLILTGLLLLGRAPSFYRDFSKVSQSELGLRTERLLQDLLEATNLVRQGQEFQLEIQEDDLNSLLAAGPLPEDFLPHSLENLQVHFLPPSGRGEEWGEVILAGMTTNFHLDAVISAHCRLNKRDQGFSLRVEKLRVGALPIPQRFFKSIISQIQDTRLENIFQEVEIKKIRVEEGWLRIVGRGRPDSE